MEGIKFTNNFSASSAWPHWAYKCIGGINFLCSGDDLKECRSWRQGRIHPDEQLKALKYMYVPIRRHCDVCDVLNQVTKTAFVNWWIVMTRRQFWSLLVITFNVFDKKTVARWKITTEFFKYRKFADHKWSNTCVMTCMQGMFSWNAPNWIFIIIYISFVIIKLINPNPNPNLILSKNEHFPI